MNDNDIQKAHDCVGPCACAGALPPTQAAGENAGSTDNTEL